jgi:hypothetical protein
MPDSSPNGGLARAVMMGMIPIGMRPESPKNCCDIGPTTRPIDKDHNPESNHVLGASKTSNPTLSVLRNAQTCSDQTRPRTQAKSLR